MVEIARTKNDDRFGGARKRLAQRLAEGGIRDVRVLDAIASVPRHLLIADALKR